ncbi:energy-coupling factor ABC transporter ATP-binding protein [Neobacillus sp. NPDC058068]|uniref:energy-coupling factor ABC transporter ATP-binding protein n=1 Tax=Neobacillus sp. NPDC058068 TaxID=3346325 RepID=UPI0036DE418D
MNAQGPQLQVTDLVYKYPSSNKNILNKVNLTINQGDFIAIIGQNGAGKTTLTKHFNGLHLPIDGKVLINGKNTKQMKTNEIIQLVGYCYQNPDHQLFCRTVYDEVAYGPKNLGFSQQKLKDSVMEALEVTKLAEKKDQYPFTLGRGERQRLAIASVISMGSPILIVDEPTTGLDTKGMEHIMNFLTRWNELGHTIMVVTHDIEMVAKYVPQTIVMAQGEIIANGDTRTVLNNKEVLERTFVKQPQIMRLAHELSAFGIQKDCLTVNEMFDHVVKLTSSVEQKTKGVG